MLLQACIIHVFLTLHSTDVTGYAASIYSILICCCNNVLHFQLIPTIGLNRVILFAN